MRSRGVVNVADLNPFVPPLTKQTAHEAAFPAGNDDHGACNNDGEMKFGDINPVISRIGT